MAGTTIKTHNFSGADGSILRKLVIQLNAVIANLDTITAKLDADAGVTDTDYGTKVTAAKIGNADGTAITA